ncbi:MAG: alpha/beta fold hydrolase [Acidobacteria bacterium]|nr:alpha/beta fold hydrolase [Acidobacteriota bacterium]MBV9069925.1 alpha/beta fold hydrolase [Acidobacteriota bacterium]MBV9188465.1 alpha/beta fold hydrolase [Acidobacteriota bacterium]
MRIFSPALLLLLVGCAGLRPFPPASVCPAPVGNIDALWSCVGRPDPAPKEGGLASTLRMANGDLTRRVILNQTPSLACNTKPWSGFEHVSQAVTGADRLEAFVHAGDAAQPVVFVVHGLYDSNSNRYVRYVASALAAHGFGVVVPDMRWHGCLISLTNTLGVLESADLMAWAKAVRDGQIASLRGRPVGMIGFSLGALDVIDTASLPEAVSRFDAGTIAVSPPAAVKDVRDRLDGLRTPMTIYFRLTLRMRNRRLGIPFWSREPFRSYLEKVAATTPFPTMDKLIAAAEPTRRLANVRRPLLILAAKNDPVLGEGAANAIAKAADPSLKYVHVIETDEGGHIGIMGRNPQWFVNAITNFFANAQHVP